MDLEQLKRDEEALKKAVWKSYVDPTGVSVPIEDGVVHPETYAEESTRILWVLKEPWEEEGAPDRGDWSLVRVLREEWNDWAQYRTFQPICYVNHGVFSQEKKWDDMPWLRNSEEIRRTLRRIAYINVSKIPGASRSLDGRIVEAYEQHSEIILSQIKAYQPHIIFACAPHVHLIVRDLGVIRPDWKHVGSASVVATGEQQRVVWVYHPNQRTKKRANYVNDAVQVATELLSD